MRKIIISCFLFFSGTILFAQHQNILIDSIYNPNEPSIHMNPLNLNEIVAGANLNNVYRSSDGGASWTRQQLTSDSNGVWGDPCILTDTLGRFYYFHLANPPSGSWIDRIVCQRLDSIDGSWNDGSYMGLNGAKAQDKEWAIFDPKSGNIYVTWTQFDDYGSSTIGDSSVILFSMSSDYGLSWTNAQRINKHAGDCIDDDDTVEGAVPALGPNGEIYVSWAGPNGLVFNYSTDQGNTWLDEERFVGSFPGGWNYVVPGIFRCNGLPVTDCDISGGPNHGNIYINWTDQRNGTDDTDVWLCKSSDGGSTWSQPKRVNDDSTQTHQFFTWMDVDQSNGYIYFVFYDRRNYTDKHTDVYMAVSKDGGESFINFKISESPFYPSDNVFFGDYTNINAQNNMVRPIWNSLDQNKLKLWTALIDTNFLGTDQVLKIKPELSIFPNPSSGEIAVSFKLKKTSNVTMSLIDNEGKTLLTLFEHKQYHIGHHIERFDLGEVDFSSGLYYLVLKDGQNQVLRKISLIR